MTFSRQAASPKARFSVASAIEGSLAHGLQRKCSCGGSAAGGECESCRKKNLQRRAEGSAEPVRASSLVHETLRSGGQPLDSATRLFMEPRFGHDFSKVRVHTGSRAAESAKSVSAMAYTVGRNIVFGHGQFAPQTRQGQHLLAHELTHTLQQTGGVSRSEESSSTGLRVSSPGDAHELAAEQTADQVMRMPEAWTGTSSSVANQTNLRIDRAPTGAGATQTPPQLTHQDVIENARRAAFIRVLQARDIVSGAGPSAPVHPNGKPGADSAGADRQTKARNLATLMFDWPNPNMSQISEILSHMLSGLSPGTAITEAAKGDKDCAGRAGYVGADHHPPIVLCEKFFTQSAEEQIRTMVHESAHLSGISMPQPEGYCGVMDCTGPCPGAFDSADSWSQYVSCLTDHGDKSDTIHAKPPQP